MPELPEVETSRRELEAAVLGRQVVAVESLDAANLLRRATPEQIREALAGASLVQTARHGKHLFLRLNDRGWLVLHFGMTGEIFHLAGEERVPPYTRMLLALEGGTRLAYADARRLGTIDLAEDVGSYVERRRLGPDALGIGRRAFVERLSARRGSVKGALMDQRHVAGIGNLYADEICFEARLDPRSRSDLLNPLETAAVHAALRHVLRTAIDRTADRRPLPRTWLLGRREEGERCPRGDGEIRRVTVAGRSTFFCPSCQGRR